MTVVVAAATKTSLLTVRLSYQFKAQQIMANGVKKQSLSTRRRLLPILQTCELDLKRILAFEIEGGKGGGSLKTSSNLLK